VTVQHQKTPGSIENGVLFGEEGQLFLASGGHAVIDFALGKRKVSPESISVFSENLLSRGDCAQRHCVPYVHVIFPDKQSVLTKLFPLGEPVCLGDVYLQGASEVANSVLYPRDLLRELGPASFQQTDTHLSDLGTAAVACSLLDRLFKVSHATDFRNIVDAINVPQKWVGDLGRRFVPELSEIRLTFPRGRSIKWFNNNVSGGNNGIVDLTFNAEARYDKRLLIFGDSFGRELARFLVHFIREVIFLRTPFFHHEMFDQISPDLVVTENVERYLSSCSSDELRPSFLLYPFLGDGQCAPNKEFAKAFSAVLSFPRKPYWDFRTSISL